MIAVFASTAFIPTGLEIAVAGGTTVAGQKLLEAVFGDQAMRELARTARDDLTRRVGDLLDTEAARYTVLLADVETDDAGGDRLRAAADAVEQARAGSGLRITARRARPRKTTPPAQLEPGDAPPAAGVA
jgi:hypothetical protein